MLGLPGIDVDAIRREMDGFRTDLTAIKGSVEDLTAIRKLLEELVKQGEKK